MSRILCSTSVQCGSSRAKALADIAQAGFTAIDLLAIDGWVHLNPSELAASFEPVASSLDQDLALHGLTPRALNSGVSPLLHDRTPEGCEKREKETKALVRLMKEREIPFAAIQPRSGDPSRPWHEVMLDSAASVREQVAWGAEEGIQFGLELHVHSSFETLDQARGLLEEWPQVPLVYDPSHFILQGLPLKETGWLMDRAVHAHLRDCAKGALQAPFGEGEVDFEWVIKGLLDRGFQGSFSLEYLETEDFDALESAQRLAGLLGKLLL